MKNLTRSCVLAAATIIVLAGAYLSGVFVMYLWIGSSGKDF